MTTHSPLIRLQAARIAYFRAQEACPHWDFETDLCEMSGHACCNALGDAAHEMREARRAYKRSPESRRLS